MKSEASEMERFTSEIIKENIKTEFHKLGQRVLISSVVIGGDTENKEIKSLLVESKNHLDKSFSCLIKAFEMWGE